MKRTAKAMLVFTVCFVPLGVVLYWPDGVAVTFAHLYTVFFYAVVSPLFLLCALLWFFIFAFTDMARCIENAHKANPSVHVKRPRPMRAVRIYSLFWPVLMLLAIGNGFVREATYGQSLSELHSHQLSTIMAMALFGVSVFLLSKYSLPDSKTHAILIGVVWLALTLCFEFLFGRYIAGHSWARLFEDYDVLSGRLWVVLLAWVTCLPYIAYKYLKPAT